MRALRRVDPLARRSLAYRGWARFSGIRAMGWVSRHVAWKLDPVLMRLTGGRLRATFLLPSALLETTGARTGLPRRNVVVYFHDGDDVVLMPSRLGDPRDPGWFHNAVAHPEVVLGGERFRAEVVNDPHEVARLWPLADRVFPAYAAYRRRAAMAGRTIPLLRLVPKRA